MDWRHFVPYLAPALVLVLVARQLIRNAPSKVRRWRIFVAPVIVAVAVVATFAMAPLPGPIWLAGFVIAVAAGGVIGFLLTHHQEYSIDHETGAITSRATPFGLILVGGFFVLRFGLKFFTSGGNPYAPQNFHPNLHPSASFIGWTDMGIMFSMGLVIARSVTTWMRTRPLVAEHKAVKAQMASDRDPSAPVETPPADA